MEIKKKKQIKQQEPISHNNNNNNINLLNYVSILSWVISKLVSLVGIIYKNMIYFIIIFLLMIIAFKTVLSSPLDLLFNFLHLPLPETLKSLMLIFQEQTNTVSSPITENVTNVTATVDTSRLEQAIKAITLTQQEMLKALEKQNEIIVSLYNSIESLTIQQNSNIGLNKVVEQLQINNKLSTDIIELSKLSMKLSRATYDASLIELSKFKQDLSLLLNNLNNEQLPILKNINKDILICSQNQTLVLKSIQEQGINAYVLNKDILAATNAAKDLQQAGFEALLKSSTNNQEYLTSLQAHYQSIETKLHQVSTDNSNTANLLREDFIKAQKELEKSTMIGFIKDKVSNIDIEVNNISTKK